MIFIGWISGALSGVLDWIFDVLLTIVLFLLDGIANIIAIVAGFASVWLLNQLNLGMNEWLNFPVITTFFGMCRAIGMSLFLAGTLYSISENLINYNTGNGVTAFRSTFFNIVKALVAVQLFTVVPPLMFRWSIELAGFATEIDWGYALSRSWAVHELDINLYDFTSAEWINEFGELLLESLTRFVGALFRVINTVLFLWGIYRFVISAMQRLGTIMLLTAKMAFTFFSFARGMGDSFMKAALNMVGANVIMFLQMFLLVTAIAYSDRNPLIVWGLIIVSAKVDQIIDFGIDLGSRTSPVGMVHATSAVLKTMLLKKGLGKAAGGASSIGGSVR